MTPQQALALAVRLFAVWLVIIIIQQTLRFLLWDGPTLDAGMITMTIFFLVIQIGITVIIWRFPNSIARGLLPTTNRAPKEAASPEMWFTLGSGLIGLWLIATAITPLTQNTVVLLFYASPETDTGSVVSGIAYFCLQVFIGALLLVGARAITRFVRWLRRYGPE